MVAEAAEVATQVTTPNTGNTPESAPSIYLSQLSRDELATTGSGPRERIELAQAKLPNVTELIASISTATQSASGDLGVVHSEQDLEGVYGPQGPAESVTDLANADALMAEGAMEDACAAYIYVIDQYPGTYQALRASNGLTKLAEGIQTATLSVAETDAIDASLPAWETLSAPGKYAIQDWYWMRAEAAFEAGDDEALAASFAKNRETATRFLSEHPDHFLALPVALELYDSQDWAAKQGLATRDAAVQVLSKLANSENPGLGRLGANCALTNYFSKDKQDRGATIIHNANILNELEFDYIDGVLDDPSVYYWVKSLIGTAVGVALETLGRYQEALDWYENPAFHIRKRGLTTIVIDYDVARIKQLQEPQNPTVGIEAFQEFINAHPDADQVSMARLEFGNIYLTAGDYSGAAALYRDVVQNYPGTEAAVLAEEALNFIATYLYGTVEVAADGKPVNQPEEDTALAMLCGPQALHRLLVNKGIESSVEELAQLAGTDETGTTMQGLIDAAESKGITLAGVEAPEPQQLDTPFIAYVDGNHYLLVTEVTPHLLAVSDRGNDPASMDFAEFARRWDGKALVLSDAPRIARLLEAETLDKVKGGGGGGGLPSPPPVPPVCDEEEEDCGDDGDGDPPPPPKPPTCDSNCPCEGTSGSPGSPKAQTGIHSPGFRPYIYPSSTTFKVQEPDFSLNIRGDNPLKFQRVYINEKGFHRPRFTDSTKPWSNNVGNGWTHNLNLHLVTTTPVFGRPLTVVFYDEKGAERTYEYNSASGGNYYYVRTANGSSRERGNTLMLEGATGKYYLSLPGGREYRFSAATNDVYRFARLEKIADRNGNEISLDYDDVVGTGKLTKVAPPSGDSRYLQLSYSGNVITKLELKKSAASLLTVQYAYNANDELTKVTDDASNEVSYSYDSYVYAATSRYITKVTDKAGRDTDYAYSFTYSSGYQAYKIDQDNAAGVRATFDRTVATGVAATTTSKSGTTYNKHVFTPVTGDASRVQSLDYYYGNFTNYERTAYEYDPLTRGRTKSTIAGRVVQQVSYNDSGRLTGIQCCMAPCGAGSVGATATAVYYETTASLYPTKRTGPDGLDINYYYDSNYNITKITHPSVAAAGYQLAYDAYGQVTTVTDPLSHATTLGYDAVGNLTSVTDPNSSTRTMYYDDYGNVTRTTNPLNKDTYYYYSYGGCGGCGGGSQLLTKVKDALNNETEMHYDLNGNLTKVIDALDREADYAYDVMDQLTQITSPSGSGNTATMAYDDIGNMTAATDFEGITTTHEYDHLGQVTKLTDPIGDIQTTYDSLGNVSTITDGLSQTTTYDYDDNNLPTKITYANGEVTRYFHDSVGRITKVGAGASGTIDPTEVFYSGATGLMTKVSYTAGGNTSEAKYHYDGRAQLTKLTDWIDGTDGLRYAHDAGGRLTTLTDYDDSTLDYTYDAVGNVLTMEDYHGSVVTYTYTDTNRVSTITAPGSKVWDYEYNALGQPTSVSTPNGVTMVYGYDIRNWLTKVEHKDGANVLDGFYYSPDDGGNITRTTYEDDEYWDYWYDGRDRLTKAERRDYGDALLHRYTYTYDAGDNMITKEIYDGTNTDTYVYAHTAANELTKESYGGTDTTFVYDAWGRITSKSNGTYSASYYHNYGSMLTKVSSDFPGEGTVEYEYGADYRRRERDDGMTVTWYNYDSRWNLLNEENSGGTLTMTYVQNPMKPVGTVLADLSGTTPATGIARYYYQDNIGSTRRLRDASKGSLAEYEYEPYGGSYSQSGAALANMFTGHNWDGIAGLYFAPYRNFIPELSIWLTRDPLPNLKHPNLYAYVRRNPVSRIDPDGRWLKEILCSLLGIGCPEEEDPAIPTQTENAVDTAEEMIETGIDMPGLGPAAPVAEALLNPNTARGLLLCDQRSRDIFDLVDDGEIRYGPPDHPSRR